MHSDHKYAFVNEKASSFQLQKLSSNLICMTLVLKKKDFMMKMRWMLSDCVALIVWGVEMLIAWIKLSKKKAAAEIAYKPSSDASKKKTFHGFLHGFACKNNF